MRSSRGKAHLEEYLFQKKTPIKDKIYLCTICSPRQQFATAGSLNRHKKRFNH